MCCRRHALKYDFKNEVWMASAKTRVIMSCLRMWNNLIILKINEVQFRSVWESFPKALSCRPGRCVAYDLQFPAKLIWWSFKTRTIGRKQFFNLSDYAWLQTLFCLYVLSETDFLWTYNWYRPCLSDILIQMRHSVSFKWRWINLRSVCGWVWWRRTFEV